MKIQKTLQGFALAAVAGLLVSSAVAQVTVSQIPGYFAADGEFNVTPLRGAGYAAPALVAGGFQTFCIYRDTGIAIPGTYFDTLNAAGIYLPPNLNISKGSAWLYDQFSRGVLVDYHYAGAGIVDPGHILSQRAEDAYQLQLAFWTLEGQYFYGPGPGALSLTQDLANPWLAKVAAQFGVAEAGLLAAMGANTPGNYNVGVLNLNVINPDQSIGAAVQPLLVRLLGCIDPNSTISASQSVNVGSTGNSACVPDAGPGASYTWTIINGSITLGQGTKCITWTAGTNGSTTLGVTVAVAGGCRSVGSKVVTVNCIAPDNTINSAASVPVLSTGNSACVADAGVGASYVWQVSNGTITGGQGTKCITWTAGTNGAATLGVTITTAAGCEAIGFKMVSVLCTTPDSTISSPMSVQVNSTGNSACTVDAGPGATYVWAIINGTITAGQGTKCITWTAGASGTTTLGVTITTAGGCGAVGSKVVSLTPPPTITVGTGDTATIGFWHNKNGQALILSMPNSPALANWLAGSFPCLYGTSAGANNLSGKSNTQIAAYFLTLFNVKGTKTDAQVLGAAFACYVTSSTLAGNNAAGYGFNVSTMGTGAKTFNVGAYGTAIGLSNNTSYTVLQLLQQANLRKCAGTFNANAFNSIFDGINVLGDIL